MDISGIKFPRTVQEILHDYQQGILKSEPREQSSERRTPEGTSGSQTPASGGLRCPRLYRKIVLAQPIEQMSWLSAPDSLAAA